MRRLVSGVVATWLWCLVIPSTHHVKAAFSSERRLFAFIRPAAQSLATEIVLSFRGGEASKAAVEDEDESERESEDEDEPEEEPEVQVAVDEENVKLDASLAASALKKTVRAQVKVAETVTATAKKAVSSKLKKKRSLLKALHVPYLIRASLNPFTLWKMTVAYWASLVNLDYLKKESSQELRSALEDKARKSGSGGPKGKRSMKRGQAKTLSDLPQLST